MQYAFVIPITELMRFGAIPVPITAPPEVALEEVTNGYVPCPIIRIDTNQGVSGLGEVRDGASPTYALFLKSRVVGENPLQLDRIFRKIKQFGGHARQGGGVCAIEMALWDIAGKVYDAPVYALVGGGKFRDKIRIYADTTESKDPNIYAQRMKERKEVMGLTWLKMDLGIEMVSDTPGTVTNPTDLNQWQANQLPHPLLGMFIPKITDNGVLPRKWNAKNSLLPPAWV